MARTHPALGGRYKLDSVVALSDMSTVYHGIHVATGRAVAVKLYNEIRASRESITPTYLQFLYAHIETAALNAVQHRRIVRHIETVTNFEAYVVTEWIPGATLRQRLDECLLTTSEAVRFGRAMLHALIHMHEQDVVHSDLKPGNIMLRNNEIGKPVALDFGLAHVGRTVPRPDRGLVLGTLEYMPREQLMSEKLDGRADVFALGGILYRGLSGRPPCGYGHPEQIAHNIRYGPPARFQASECPLALARLIEDMIIHDKARRPNALQALKRLDAISPPSFGEKLRYGLQS